MDGIASHASIAIENARLFHGARQEIETRRKTEQSLHESEARFRDFAQVASDVLWETDVNHRIVSVVGDTIRALGAPSAEIVGKTRWEFSDADTSRPEWRDHIQTQLERRPFQGFEFKIPDVDGGYRWISSNGRPTYDGAGRFIGYRGTSTNITAKKAAERRAARNALQQQSVAVISQLALQDIRASTFSRRRRSSSPAPCPCSSSASSGSPRTAPRSVWKEAADGRRIRRRAAPFPCSRFRACGRHSVARPFCRFRRPTSASSRRGTMTAPTGPWRSATGPTRMASSSSESPMATRSMSPTTTSSRPCHSCWRPHSTDAARKPSCSCGTGRWNRSAAAS